MEQANVQCGNIGELLVTKATEAFESPLVHCVETQSSPKRVRVGLRSEGPRVKGPRHKTSKRRPTGWRGAEGRFVGGWFALLCLSPGCPTNFNTAISKKYRRAM